MVSARPQVVIRWHIEHRVVVIPKSTNPARIAENAGVFGFGLSAPEINELDHLSASYAYDVSCGKQRHLEGFDPARQFRSLVVCGEAACSLLFVNIDLWPESGGHLAGSTRVNNDEGRRTMKQDALETVGRS
jgi:hypothetical protein